MGVPGKVLDLIMNFFVGGAGGSDWEMFVHDSASCVFKNVFKYSFCIVIVKTTVRIPNHCGLNLAGI